MHETQMANQKTNSFIFLLFFQVGIDLY